MGHQDGYASRVADLGNHQWQHDLPDLTEEDIQLTQRESCQHIRGPCHVLWIIPHMCVLIKIRNGDGTWRVIVYVVVLTS
jgi:hypothetical protein